MSEKKISKKCNQRSPDQELRRRGRKKELSNLLIEGHAARLMECIFLHVGRGNAPCDSLRQEFMNDTLSITQGSDGCKKNTRKNGGHGWLSFVKLKWSGRDCLGDHAGISPRHLPSRFLLISKALRIVSNNSSG